MITGNVAGKDGGFFLIILRYLTIQRKYIMISREGMV